MSDLSPLSKCTALRELSAAGCGTNNAGTAANRWSGNMNDAATGNNAQDRRWQTGLEDMDGAYSANEKGRVKGFEGYDPTDPRLTETGSDELHKAKTDAKKGAADLKNAAKDMGDAAKNAAKSIGNTAEDALDDLTGKTKN